MALADRVSLLASRVAAEAKSLWAAVESKADADHNHDGVYAKPADLPDVSDVIREGDPRLTDDRDPTAHTHDDRYYTEAEVDSALSGKADAAHDHDGTYQPVGDYATRDELPTVPDVSDVIREGDPRLSDPRPPTAHDHDGVYQPVGDYAAADHDHPEYVNPDLSGYVENDDPRLTDPRTPTAHTHTAAQISDATTLGRAIMQASSATAARTAIGAGTSNLQLGTGSTTAAAGNHTHSDLVPTSRTVAGKALTSNITLMPADVGAAPASHHHDERYVRIHVDSTPPTDTTMLWADTSAL